MVSVQCRCRIYRDRYAHICVFFCINWNSAWVRCVMQECFVVEIHGQTSRRWHGFVYVLHVVFVVGKVRWRLGSTYIRIQKSQSSERGSDAVCYFLRSSQISNILESCRRPGLALFGVLDLRGPLLCSYTRVCRRTLVRSMYHHCRSDNHDQGFGLWWLLTFPSTI